VEGMRCLTVVSLARAVYSRAGVLLLDDGELCLSALIPKADGAVLSAVDAHTAHALMANCIQGPILAGRTVLLVSHHTALVSPAAAYIVALENVGQRHSSRIKKLTNRETSSSRGPVVTLSRAA
jgi:ABC-type nitrate/sulfonate/bicarbonate transport system ATPase subunit